MDRFNGAWEEKGVIGPRVEIQGNRLVRLWNANIVLETDFETFEEGGKTVLKLVHSGLRDSSSIDPYATIKECYYDGAALVFIDEYRFAGETELRMTPTSNSRYGNVTIVSDEVMPQLQGKWESKYTDLLFEGSFLSISGHGLNKPESVTQVVAVKHNSQDSDEIFIIDKDPAKKSIGTYTSIIFCDGSLKAYVRVSDTQSMEVAFTKLPD